MTRLEPHFVAALGGAEEPVAALPPATGVSFHSGRVRPGDAFFALPGAAGHGVVYADQALAAGAAFIVSDEPHPRGLQVENPAGLLLELGKHARAQLGGPVVGVTGSAGKTSTKGMLAAALNAQVSPGNFNTPLALARVLVDAWLSGRTAADDALVLELGIDHAGEMDALIALARPTHAVLTLIAASHLSGLGNIQTVAREKLKLVDTTECAFVSEQAAPFLNAEQRTKSTVYGLNEDVDINGTVTKFSPRGQTLECLDRSFTLPYLGDAMATNAVGALCVARHLGIDLNTAAKRLEGVKLEPGRLEVRHRDGLTIIDDTYNSNPASAEVALGVLEHFPRPRVAVLGDMLELGTESEAHHRALGRRTRGLDAVFAVGSEARFIASENGEAAFIPLGDLPRIATQLPTQGTVLVKGSRGLRLERLVALLEQREGTLTP